MYQIFIERGLVDLVDLTVVMGNDPEATAFFPNLNKYGYHAVKKEDFWGNNETNGHLISKQIWVKDEIGDYSAERFNAELYNNLGD